MHHHPNRSEKERKPVKCSDCGLQYGARALHCPQCQAPNPTPAGSGLSALDRMIGVIILGIAVLLAIPTFFFVYWNLEVRRLSVYVILLAAVPIATAFVGILVIIGINPRDFYSWWGSLSRSSQWLLWVLLGLVAVAGVFWFTHR